MWRSRLNYKLQEHPPFRVAQRSDSDLIKYLEEGREGLEVQNCHQPTQQRRPRSGERAR